MQVLDAKENISVSPVLDQSQTSRAVMIFSFLSLRHSYGPKRLSAF